MLEPDFTVWRLWQAPPLEASATIGAIVVAGEFPVDHALAESLPKLGLIACFTAGYDGVDLAWASERGLKVSHSPGVNHEDVADHAMGLMLAAWRGLLEGDAIVREGRWRPTEKRITRSLGGHRLGIVGLGAIGEAVARRAAAFGLKIAWWGPNEKPDAELAAGREPAGAGGRERHPDRRRPRRRRERQADRPPGDRGAGRARIAGQRRARPAGRRAGADRAR